MADSRSRKPSGDLQKNTGGRFCSGLRHAAKSVRYNWRQYVSFFIALFLCQSFCWILTISSSTNTAHTYERIRKEYDYHLLLTDLSDFQRMQLQNVCLKLAEQNKAENGPDSELPYTVYEKTEGVETVICVRFGEALFPDRSMVKICTTFRSSVLNQVDGEFTVTESPLYTCYEAYIRPNQILLVIISAILLFLSVALLIFLYQIRLSHHKYLYGIYMSFGAGFKKLFETSVYEMLFLSALSLLPSFLFSLLLMLLIYLPRGVGISLSFVSILLVIFFNFLAVFLSVYLPMKRLSRMTPVSLIASEDNSGLVSSPRRSFHMVEKRFPRDYELYSFCRYRKYYARLILTATVFSAFFLSGIYLCDLYRGANQNAVGEYVVTVPSDLDADEAILDVEDMISLIDQVEGVSYVSWEEKTEATAVRSHLLCKAENQFRSGGVAVYTSAVKNKAQYTKANYEALVEEGYALATNSFAYMFYDSQMLDLLCQQYTVDGDPYRILTDPNAVIISESLNNAKVYRFSPGDVIVLAERAGGKINADANYLDGIGILTQQIENFEFRYHERTVCAVIRDLPSSNYLTVGMGSGEYEYFTDADAAPGSFTVYLDRTSDLSRLKEIRSAIRSEIGVYLETGYSLTGTGTFLSELLKEERQSDKLIFALSLCILLISPVIWFFSQIFFYLKREKEFRILEAFGAFGNEIEGIHRDAGILLSLLSIVSTVALGFLTNYIIYLFCNRLLVSIGIFQGIRFSYAVSPVAMVLTVVVSVACGFLSSYVSYLLYRNKRRKERAAFETGTGPEPESKQEMTLTTAKSEERGHDHDA